MISSIYQHQSDDIKNWQWSLKVSKTVNPFLDYHKLNSQKNTIRAYGLLLAKFRDYFPDHDLAFIAPEEILSFLTSLNGESKQLTKHTR